MVASQEAGIRAMRRVGLVVLVVAGTGCASLRHALQFTAPDIRLQEIRITGLGLTGGTFDLALDVYNPNGYRLRSTRLEVGIDLEDTHFGDAVMNLPVELPSQQHTLVTVPVRFEWAGLGAGAKGLITRQAIRYGLTGVATIDTPIGDQRVQLHGSGEVPLRALRP
jgi:LEA14-like dessication related protein